LNCFQVSLLGIALYASIAVAVAFGNWMHLGLVGYVVGSLLGFYISMRLIKGIFGLIDKHMVQKQVCGRWFPVFEHEDEVYIEFYKDHTFRMKNCRLCYWFPLDSDLCLTGEGNWVENDLILCLRIRLEFTNLNSELPNNFALFLKNQFFKREPVVFVSEDIKNNVLNWEFRRHSERMYPQGISGTFTSDTFSSCES